MTNEPTAPPRMPRVLGALVVLLVLQRVLYHLAYLTLDPFALVAFSDGQMYEEAARDILAHAPLGSAPLYLQGLYAYVLALGMALHPATVAGLCAQLLLALAALAWLARSVLSRFGGSVGGVSVAVLLAYPSVAFYENKYLSVAIGMACNMLVIAVFLRVLARGPSRGGALALGVASGLAVLGRANLVLALPFSLYALARAARERGQRSVPLMAACVLGVALALAPLALRNQWVIGRPDVLPSHGGGIPFYIGNNPHANGRWNDAGGLLSGQVLHEREELAHKLGVHERGAALDAALGEKLYAMAFAFMRDAPGAWLALEGRKLWDTLGNHAFIRDYDLFGERELLGPAMPVGLPFGVLLALGVLGLWALWTRNGDGDRALCVLLVGQLLAVLAANLLWFTSAQNRVPLSIPLALCAGPGLWALARRMGPERFAEPTTLPTTLPAARGPVLVLALALGAQAFWPRLPTVRPSSTHYYNLANAEERLGRVEPALAHYRIAAERSPKQPMFKLRLAHLLRLTRRDAEARVAFEAVLRMPNLPPPIRDAARAELAMLPAASAP